MSEESDVTGVEAPSEAGGAGVDLSKGIAFEAPKPKAVEPEQEEESESKKVRVRFWFLELVRRTKYRMYRTTAV